MGTHICTHRPTLPGSLVSTRATPYALVPFVFRQRSLHPIGPQRFRNANVASGAHRGLSGESSDQSRAEDLHDSVVVSIRLGSIEWLSLAIIICTTQLLPMIATPDTLND